MCACVCQGSVFSSLVSHNAWWSIGDKMRVFEHSWAVVKECSEHKWTNAKIDGDGNDTC